MYTRGEMTSHNLWSRYDRHFVGILGLLCFGVKFNPLVYRNVCMITSLPTKRIRRYDSGKNFSRVLPTRRRRKPASIEITPLHRPMYLFYLFIIKSYTKYTTDRHTVRTMKAVKAALNTNTRQNIVYKITRKPCRQ